MAVVAETRGNARVGGSERIELTQRFTLCQRLRAPHLDVEADERNREREKSRRYEERGKRKQCIDDPEQRPARDGCQFVFLVGYIVPEPIAPEGSACNDLAHLVRFLCRTKR